MNRKEKIEFLNSVRNGDQLAASLVPKIFDTLNNEYREDVISKSHPNSILILGGSVIPPDSFKGLIFVINDKSQALELVQNLQEL